MIRETGHGRNPRGEDSITFTGSKAEIEVLERMARGVSWVKQNDDGLQEQEGFYKVELTDDPHLELYFRREGGRLPNHQEYLPTLVRKVFDQEKAEAWSPSIYVQSIMGYSAGGAESYKQKARTLEKAGFVCMRSRRDRDGSYWELFYLPGPWAAQGDCKGMNAEAVVRWLCNIVRPGTIDLAGTRWGLSAPE